MKVEATPKTVYLKDYAAPEYLIESVDLAFDLHEDHATVTSRLRVRRNPASPLKTGTLTLNGEELVLESIALDGEPLAAAAYTVTEKLLSVPGVPDAFTLETRTRIEPQKNLAFEGLYRSGGMFCTQCEAEGFRKITYFTDRPDVMAVYTVTIEADQAKYPILLSNGNLVETRALGNGRHMAKWHDPFKKPCYLFALVAGDLGVVEDTFRTRSGRDVKLQIFARHGIQDRCLHAMDSLKKSMKWDEEVYGREYDLDIFMIVAVDDFNMGAMENKGLNVFNSNYILAKPETATDTDYDNVLAVVGHEYFHNWTGNRITCRDWFQLSLKEGLTVFRDQEFSADMGSRAVKRIEDVVRLRTLQFAEDGGPMAHPVRPQSYIEINNFYTVTVYEKGAELIRMLRTILGPEGFRKGTDKYFELFDGQAVTTDDFVKAMELGNGVDLSHFKLWYDQAGTPHLNIQTAYDAAAKRYTLTVTQSCPPTPGQDKKEPFHVPLAVGLLDSHGSDMKLELEGPQGPYDHLSVSADGTRVLHVTEARQSFVFKNVAEAPVPSLLRGFSAPVKLEFEMADRDLGFLLAHDSDEFNRWEAAQTLAIRTIRNLVRQIQANGGTTAGLMVPADVLEAFGKVLADRSLDPAFVAHLMTLPSEPYLVQFFAPIDIDAIHAARVFMKRSLARKHEAELVRIYNHYYQCGGNQVGAKAAGERALKNSALVYLTLLGGGYLDKALAQAKSATNMTDELAAIYALTDTACAQREDALRGFRSKWGADGLVMNKWFNVQAQSGLPDALDRVKELAKDPLFDATNPNKVYALYVAFGAANLARFHDKCGAGYKFIADRVLEIDKRNPQVASRLVSTFNQWKRYDSERQALMKAELERIVAQPGLSPNVFEIASKALK